MAAKDVSETTNTTEGKALSAEKLFIQLKPDEVTFCDLPNGGFDITLHQYQCLVRFERISDNGRGTQSEITIEQPYGTVILQPSLIHLTDFQARAKIIRELAGTGIGGEYLPWDIILNFAMGAALRKIRETQPLPEQPPTVKSMSEVTAETVKWLWHPYIPFGKLTMLEGDPGEGKSWASLAIATALSVGAQLPGQAEGAVRTGETLLMSAEDGLGDTIKPRLMALQADCRQIHALDGLFTLDDKGFQVLESAIADFMPVLVIIDPLVAYLSSDMDIHRANQVRHATSKLAKLANGYGPAILAVRHLTKGGSSKAIYRGAGSIDFTASARSVLLAGSDPDNPTAKGIVHIKSNLAMKGEAIGYELKEGGFYWTGKSELTYERIFATDTGGGGIAATKSFLLEILADGPVLTKEIYAEAESRGIASERTINAAKKALGVVASREGEKGKRGGGNWSWKLPDTEEGLK